MDMYVFIKWSISESHLKNIKIVTVKLSRGDLTELHQYVIEKVL